MIKRDVLELGPHGGHISAPAREAEADVPLENVLASIEAIRQLPGHVIGQRSDYIPLLVG